MSRDPRIQGLCSIVAGLTAPQPIDPEIETAADLLRAAESEEERDCAALAIAKRMEAFDA